MSPDRPPTHVWWIKLLLGLAAVFLLFHGSATALGSDRGQAGMVVASLVVLATLAVERLAFRNPIAIAARDLGLGRPAWRGIGAALAVGVLLLAVIPVFAAVTDARVLPYPGWPTLVPGLFAQAGVAEEVLFRGFLFGRIRQGRAFWPAAFLATLPFVAVHLIIFTTMSWPVALAAVLLSAIMAFPLAYLFELGGNTIWAPAILHFVAQGAIKVIEVRGVPPTHLPLVWMAACAVLPFLVFVAPRPLAVPSTGLQLSPSR